MHPGGDPWGAGGVCNGVLPPWRVPSPASDFGGGFVRATDLEASLVDADTVPYTGDKHDFTSALAGDFDGDGRTDVLYNHLRAGTWLVTQPAPGTWRNTGPLPGGLALCVLSADLDADGQADVLCAGAGGAIAWGGPGGPGWAMATRMQGQGQTPMASVAWDLDEDGLLDLVLSPFGGTKQVLRNRGDRTFEDVGARWGIATDGMTWEVGFTDLDGDGRPDVFMFHDGSGKQNYAFRALGPGMDGEPRFERMRPVPPMCDDTGIFALGNATPMGVALGDLDGDGSPEMYLALTNDDMVLSRQPTGSWLDVRPSLGILEPVTSTGQSVIHWSPALWDIDHDGLLDVLIAGGDDEGHARGADRGVSFNALFHGLPGGRFEEVHARAELVAPGHFMDISRGDLDGDGALDLLLGGFGQPVVAYVNHVTPRGHHLLLRLRGQTSNPSGLGAQVTVTAGSLHRTYPMGDRFGTQVMDPPVVDAALGPATQADEVRVLWPSGYEQVVGPLPGDTAQTVTEPPLVTLSSPGRHAWANGVQTVTVTVRPVDPRGAPRAGAVVTTELTVAGGAAWTGPAQVAADGSVTRTLRAPTTAGSSVVEVHIDGVALRVRPRIWWDG